MGSTAMAGSPNVSFVPRVRFAKGSTIDVPLTLIETVSRSRRSNGSIACFSQPNFRFAFIFGPPCFGTGETGSTVLSVPTDANGEFLKIFGAPLTIAVRYRRSHACHISFGVTFRAAGTPRIVDDLVRDRAHSSPRSGSTA